MVVRSLKLSNVSVLVGPGISCTKTQALFNLRLPISSAHDLRPNATQFSSKAMRWSLFSSPRQSELSDKLTEVDGLSD